MLPIYRETFHGIHYEAPRGRELTTSYIKELSILQTLSAHEAKGHILERCGEIGHQGSNCQ